MTLTDNKGKIHLENQTEEVIWLYIDVYAKARKLGLYYRNHLLENGNTWVDYGSHTHFFEISNDLTFNSN